jgi:glycosyltransferase involved in cell wall biosynthesis
MRILSIGELHTSKGYDIALSYLKKLKDVPWTYHILGEGDEQANLEKEVKKFGLEERVFFYGYVEKASSYMNSFDIFFLPSRTEALGYVVIEALNTSIPIVAHAVGGVPEIIKHDEGSLLLSLGAKKNIGLLRGILNRTTMLDTSKREALRIPFTKEAMVVATEKVYLG